MWLNKRIIGIRLKLSGRAQHVVPATEEGAVTKDSACPKTLLWNLPCLRPCIIKFLRPSPSRFSQSVLDLLFGECI